MIVIHRESREIIGYGDAALGGVADAYTESPLIEGSPAAQPLQLLAQHMLVSEEVEYKPIADSHEPVVILPEAVTTDAEAAINECGFSNKWAIVGAFEKPSERKPLHAIRILEEDADEEPTRVAWGGREYASEGEFSELNIRMINRLVTAFGSDPKQVEQLDPITVSGENDSGTKIEIIKYPLRSGWTVDVAVVAREPRPLDVQAAHYQRHHDIYDRPPIEEPTTYLNIWACPPGKGLETLYFAPSGKEKAAETVAALEEETRIIPVVGPIAQ
jgi:hypothetical protein